LLLLNVKVRKDLECMEYDSQILSEDLASGAVDYHSPDNPANPQLVPEFVLISGKYLLKLLQLGEREKQD